MTQNSAKNRDIDPAELAKFQEMAASWWDPRGKFKPLHQFNPARIGYIRDQAVAHFKMPVEDIAPLRGLTLLDIGCGGGLLSEPMTRLGAQVTGIDPVEKNIKIAGLHAAEMGLQIDYRAITVEELAASGAQFDIVLNMEVVEHVADVASFLHHTAQLIKPGGMMIVATLNRTLKSLALAKIGAEYILRWLPKGTHEWDKFIKPDELAQHLTKENLTIADMSGVVYNPLFAHWKVSRDMSVNYMITAQKS